MNTFLLRLKAASVLLISCMLPIAAVAEYSGDRAGVKNNLVTMFNYQKPGMMVNMFNAENDKMTYMIAGKYWKVAYMGRDNSEVVETEYRYNSTTGAMESVYNKGTNTMTLYVAGKSVFDVTVPVSVNANLVKAQKKAGGGFELVNDAAVRGKVTLTASYEYNTSGIMTSKRMYGYVGDTNATAANTLAKDVDGDNTVDAGYAIVQSMTFKDGKQDVVKNHWVQDAAHNWSYKGDATAVVTTKYLWNGNDLAAVLSGDNIVQGTNGQYTGVTNVALYKAGKDDCAFKIDDGTYLSFANGKVSVVGVNTGVDGVLDGAKKRITKEGTDTSTSTQLAVKASQTLYDGIKKLYAVEYNMDAEDVTLRGARTTSKTVFDTHGRSAYSINYKDGAIDALGKLWKYNDTIDSNKRQFTFDMAGIEIKQKTDTANAIVPNRSLLTICGFTIELNCAPSAAASLVASLSNALLYGGTYITSFNSSNGSVAAATNPTAINKIRGMFTKMGTMTFDSTTSAGQTNYIVNITGIEDQVEYASSATQYVVDFSNIQTGQTVYNGSTVSTNQQVATINITYMDENGQQQAQFQTLGILYTNGTFLPMANATWDDTNKRYNYSTSAIETWTTAGVSGTTGTID